MDQLDDKMDSVFGVVQLQGGSILGKYMPSLCVTGRSANHAVIHTSTAGRSNCGAASTASKQTQACLSQFQAGLPCGEINRSPIPQPGMQFIIAGWPVCWHEF